MSLKLTVPIMGKYKTDSYTPESIVNEIFDLFKASVTGEDHHPSLNNENITTELIKQHCVDNHLPEDSVNTMMEHFTNYSGPGVLSAIRTIPMSSRNVRVTKTDFDLEELLLPDIKKLALLSFEAESLELVKKEMKDHLLMVKDVLANLTYSAKHNQPLVEHLTVQEWSPYHFLTETENLLAGKQIKKFPFVTISLVPTTTNIDVYEPCNMLRTFADVVIDEDQFVFGYIYTQLLAELINLLVGSKVIKYFRFNSNHSCPIVGSSNLEYNLTLPDPTDLSTLHLELK
jgi:hypothetical protein